MRLPYHASNSPALRLIFISMNRATSCPVDSDTGKFFSSSRPMPRTGWKIRNMQVLRLWTNSCVPDVVCELGPDKSNVIDIVRMWIAMEPVYEAAVNSGGLPLHSALIERHGQAVLLVGDGGIGKSTCCRRLTAPWRPHSDDEVLILKDKRQKFVVHPIPTWSDYLWGQSENLACQRSFSSRGDLLSQKG